MQTQFESGTAAVEIAKRFKISDAAVYYHAKKRSWKRPNPPAGATAPTPAGEKLGGRIHCSSCTLMTEYDPCQHCGKKLKRAWR